MADFTCLYFTGELLKVLNRFYKRSEIQRLAAEHGLDGEEGLFTLRMTISANVSVIFGLTKAMYTGRILR